MNNMEIEKTKKKHRITKNLKKFEKDVGEKIDKKIILFRVFDDPRPKYIAKVTLVDKFLDKAFLWMFPTFIKPNYITIFRFITIPFIIFFFLYNYYKIAFILFLLSALSDALDGAMARTRSQITDWGIVFDPFADKLLIGTVGGILIFKFLSPLLAFVIILIEIVLMASAYYRFKGEYVPAKTVGKLKMIFQCVGVGFIFLFLFFHSAAILFLASFFLYLSVLFATLSIFVYRSI